MKIQYKLFSVINKKLFSIRAGMKAYTTERLTIKSIQGITAFHQYATGAVIVAPVGGFFCFDKPSQAEHFLKMRAGSFSSGVQLRRVIVSDEIILVPDMAGWAQINDNASLISAWKNNRKDEIHIEGATCWKQLVVGDLVSEYSAKAVEILQNPQKG